ncbi:MAG: MATE family efflux transporter [Kiritimatiellae bacterium]|nr:MATE family efflux transporter [Kiritimatiellia bacterium]
MDKNHMDMCHGPLYWQIVRFGVPVLLSGLLQLGFNMADLIVIGRFGSAQSLGAVGVTSPIIGLLLNIFCGLSVGGSVIIAQYFGAHDRRNTSRAVHTAVALSLLGGVCIMVLSMAVIKPLLVAMHVTEDVLGRTCLYMWIYSCGIPFSILYNFCYGVLRAVGDTRRPTLYLVAAGVLNVALNLLFVIRFRLDVAGVALATVASQGLSAALIVNNLRHAHDACRLNWRLLRIHPHILRHMLRIGVPAGFQTSFYSIANIAIMSCVAGFGALALAGNAAAINLEGMLWTTTLAFHQAAMSFVGQNYGGGQYGRLRRSILYSEATVVPLILVLGWTFFLFSRTIVGFYNPDPAVAEYGRLHMKYCFTLYFICSTQEIVAGSLRGLGISFKPAIAAMVGICITRLLWVWFVFPDPRFHTMGGLYLCYPFSWVIALVPNVWLLFRQLSRLPRTDGAKPQDAPAA